MELNKYQELAQKTANMKLEHKTRLAVAALGLTGEGGELADYIKKHIGHGHSLDQEKVIKELGDVMWYIAEVASILGFTLEEIAQTNIEKLKARYPEGFSEERSINRKKGDI